MMQKLPWKFDFFCLRKFSPAGAYYTHGFFASPRVFFKRGKQRNNGGIIMARKYLTAGLLLVLTLSLTACGTSDKAGTSAHRWDGGTNAASQDWAIQRQADARGPLSGSTDGSYHADSQGRVDGYHARSYDGKRGQAKSNRDKAGDDLKKAGENAKDTAKDLGKAAQDAARSIGDTAEDALDGMKQAAKNATDSAQKSTSAR